MRQHYGKMIAIIAITLGICGCNAKNTDEITESISSEQSELAEPKDGRSNESNYENSIPMIIAFSDVETTVDKSDNQEINVIGEVEPETLEILEEWKTQLIDYLDKRGIDTSKASTLGKVYWCEIQGDALAFYEDNEVFLNKKLLSDMEKFRYAYTHEITHHFLGLNDSNTMLKEGFCDCVAMDVTGYEDINYLEFEIFCQQILIADPDILKYICEDGNVGDKIDERLRNVKRIWYAPKHNLKPSEIIETLSLSIWYHGEDFTHEEYAYYLKQIQEIVWAYCRTFKLTDFQMNLIKQNSFDFNF